jgi:L-methionine (R)-S-oxide reductase
MRGGLDSGKNCLSDVLTRPMWKAPQVRQDNNELLQNLEALLHGSDPWITTLSNAAAFIYAVLPDINWAGFYLLSNGELILGPFGGKPACTRIEMGKGVCGAAARELRTIVVANVDDFPGHIACDAESRSEIVVPLASDGTLWGVLDIDSPTLDRFAVQDQELIEAFARAINAKVDVSTIRV